MGRVQIMLQYTVRVSGPDTCLTLTPHCIELKPSQLNKLALNLLVKYSVIALHRKAAFQCCYIYELLWQSKPRLTVKTPFLLDKIYTLSKRIQPFFCFDITSS